MNRKHGGNVGNSEFRQTYEFKKPETEKERSFCEAAPQRGPRKRFSLIFLILLITAAAAGLWLSSSRAATSDISTAAALQTKVTAMKESTATITAAAEEGSYSKNQIEAETVLITSITLSPEIRTLKVGDTLQLTVFFQPTVATNKTLTYESRDNSKATVNSTGLVTAVSSTLHSGPVTVTLTTTDGSNITRSCSITVQNRHSSEDADKSWYTGHENNALFELRSTAQLAGLAELVNSGTDFTGKTITVKDDLDLKGWDWTPIGTKDAPFNGTFEGCGKTVNSLSAGSEEVKDNAGFFGVIGDKGTVRDLTVTGDVTGKENVGILAGINNGTIANCKTTGSAAGKKTVGGMVGLNNGTIKGAVSEADAETTGYLSTTGGIAGKNTGTIESSSASGKVTGNDCNNGGIAGTNSGKITEVSFTGEIKGSGLIGQIAGKNEEGGVITGASWIRDKEGHIPVGNDETYNAGKYYSSDTSGDMPITSAIIKLTNIRTDEKGGFYITAEAYPKNAKDRRLKLTQASAGEAASASAWSFVKAAWAAGTLTLTPDVIEADGKEHYVATVGAAGTYRVDVGRASDGKKLSEFTLASSGADPVPTPDPTPSTGGGSGGCSAGFASLALLALLPLLKKKKK